MPAAPDSNYRQILGVRFFIGSAAEAVQIGLRGGLVVVPAAPALVELERDSRYRAALLDADLALTDSGFMVLLWNLLAFEKIRRTSGLEYLKLLIEQPVFRKPNATLWIMPTEKSRDRNIAWLNSRGVSIKNEDCYLAPVYAAQNVSDPDLLSVIEARRPEQIVIALGGGIQEKLGHHLKQSMAKSNVCSSGFSRRGAGADATRFEEVDALPPKGGTPYSSPTYNPGIHCIGAAIGFLSGDQVNIPAWADHLFLGWFFRCLSQPGKFLPRYWKARRLLPMLLKYREKLPAPPKT
jgi:N-acetylglucosaminyldiphosphoundecaprenol N-acetyl-beta-D-mannosaminyltransferase